MSYTTEARLQGVEERRGRFRPMAYGLLTAAMLATMIGLLHGRSNIDATVTRAPGDLFRVLDDGTTENAFSAHILNNDDKERDVRLSLSGFDGADLVVPFSSIRVQPGGERVVPVFVLAPPDRVSSRTHPFDFVISSDGDEVRIPGMFTSGAQ